MPAKKAKRPVAHKVPAAKATASRSSRQGPEPDASAVPETKPAPTNGFAVVGVGASAGGLEAISELLTNLPPDIPMAIVLVQHLDPKHSSLLTELLARTTPMPVVQVRPGTRVEPAHVYVIPPNTTLTIAAGVLELSPRAVTSAPHMPVDTFLRSLAEERGDRAIGVVLSGSASDGALGIKAVKGEGGVTFAQDPETAGHDGMPRSAIASGAVDFVLPPRGIAAELARIGRHPYLHDPAPHAVDDEPIEARALEHIYRLLRQETGVDFRLYRQTTIRRRIARRMLVHKVDTLQSYQGVLEGNRAEIQVLYNDMLIGVTRFFRDPEAFAAVQETVRARLALPRSADQALRVWVPGCATGEEAYSLAMALLEAIDRSGTKVPLQVFGSDVSEAAVARARTGVYPLNVELDVSPERLRRFFTRIDGQYQVKKSLRELCIFARHNLAKDPPFSGIDVISCRNVMIYLDATMQRRIMDTFQFALRTGGLLLLGNAETIGPLSDFFSVIDKKQKLYVKKPTSSRFALDLPTREPRPETPRPLRMGGQRPVDVPPPTDLQREIDRLLLGRYAPAGVLVNEAYEILQFRGHTGPYLEPASGSASLNLMKMAREGLLMELRTSMASVRKRGAAVRREGLRVKQNGGSVKINLEVVPVRGLHGESNYLVLFENASPAPPAAKPAPVPRAAPRRAHERENERLRQELTATKEFLQSIVEDREAANEELQSANEELQSSNEELLSTNEELETAKEELQSVNEELTTVNEELQHRNTELGHLNNDLNNLIAGVDIPIVILGDDLRIRRYSPRAARVFNLRPGDIGRPLAAVHGNIDVPDLEQLCAEVGETARAVAREVPDREGGWYSLHLRPYRTSENVIDGVMLTLVDISTVKHSLEQVAAARDYAETIVDTVRTPLVVLDEDFRVRTANRSFYETFHVTMEQVANRVIFDLGNGQWDVDAFRRALAELVERGTPFDDFEIEHDFPAIGVHAMLLNARRIRRDSEPARTLLLAIEDITPRRQAERELRASEEVRYRRLFETARDGIVLIDADSGQISNVNPSWTTLTGASAESLIGRKLWDIDAFEDVEPVRTLVRELQERDFVRHEDLPIRGAGGVRRHVELACNGYRLGGRRVIQCIARDITDRVDALQLERKARAEAEAANRAKDDFLSVLSHELRTPLTAMLGWVRVLRKGTMEPSKTDAALETVERNTRLLAQLIEDLLDVSRIAAGKLGIEVRDVDLGAVVRGAVETVRESAENKGLELGVHLPETHPTVRGDRHRLQQVVWNLLSNAVKFTPKGGRVDVRLEVVPAGARITVSDTGRGIAAMFISQIFDRFRQAEGVATRTQGGLGLGLAIVRSLVELHGGRVSAFSAGEGQGATFTVELPRGEDQAIEDDKPARASADTPAMDVRLDGLRVLIVEDDTDTGRMLTQSLGDRGADVEYVDTVQAALAAIDQTSLHVVVSDIGMPGEDGYELIRRMRALPDRTRASVPAIALSAFAREEDKHRALESGFDRHLAKPIDPTELARTVLEVFQAGGGRGGVTTRS